MRIIAWVATEARVGPTRVGVKVEETQFKPLPSLFSWN